MMKTAKRILISITAATMFGSVHAGSSTGKVGNIFMHTPDVVMFSAGAFSDRDKPACNTTNEWAIKLSDPAGKGFLAILLSAQAQGKSVTVVGYANTCQDWFDREFPSYIKIID